MIFTYSIRQTAWFVLAPNTLGEMFKIKRKKIDDILFLIKYYTDNEKKSDPRKN
uniref:Uncharacterized protein n=1 Tax=Leptospira santarosai serovar Arenal str. MAVJ 401 TaxID=1049976 RepID=M6JJ94_9LEPT|nr:hypothetical protein LEP1GSC063_0013 [Leptospira santarosai serovar Arenal str. MAVJ 401]